MDISLFRAADTLDQIRQSEVARGHPSSFVDDVVTFDQGWKSNLNRLQALRAQLNQMKKEITKLRTTNVDIVDMYTLRVAESAQLKMQIADLESSTNKILELRDTALSLIGNLVHPSVPVHSDESQNIVIRTWAPDKQSQLPARLLHHSEVMFKLGMYDKTAGAAVAGHRGYFLKGDGVMLNQALIQFGLRFLCNRNFVPLQPPFFMTSQSMKKTAQLSEFDELLYSVGEGIPDTEPKYLIATSEQPISCYHQDQWIEKTKLPLMYAGYSSCFRKEAGNGKDVSGLFRLHQFEKVEQFCITAPDKSWEMYEEMLKNSEEFLQALGIGYRVVCIVSGALNNAAAKKYDIEGYFPQTQEYRELVSCSNCTDYQSRQLLVRYGFKDAGSTQFVHMLNSTLCATERTMCCIAENYQTDIGMKIPDVLTKYLERSELFY